MTTATPSLIDQRLEEGLNRLPGGPLREPMTTWARSLLSRLALGLLQDGVGPEGAIRSPSRAVEDELAQALNSNRLRAVAERRGAGRGAGGHDGLRLLLGTFGDLAAQADWLTREFPGQAPRFADPAFATALIADAFLAQPMGPARDALRRRLGGHEGWADVARQAVEAGDPIGAWVDLYLGERDPVAVRQRLVVTCGALGGIPAGTPPTEAVRSTVQQCIAALFWFAPAWAQSGAHSGMYSGFREEPSGWYLRPKDFWGGILGLAQAGSRVQMESPGPDPRLVSEIPAPLGPLLRSLELPWRLSEAECRAVTALICPVWASEGGHWDAAFWDQLMRGGQRLWDSARTAAPQVHWVTRWLRYVAVPALRRVGRLHQLVLPLDGAMARLSWSYLDIREAWYEAFRATWNEQPASHPELIAAWAQVAWAHRFPGGTEQRRLLTEEIPALLQAENLWPEAQERLRQCVDLSGLRHFTVGGAWDDRDVPVLRLCELSEASWRVHLAAVPLDMVIPWRTLLESGAPESAVGDLIVKAARTPQPDYVRERLREHPGWLALRQFVEAQPGRARAQLLSLLADGDAYLGPIDEWPPGAWLDDVLRTGGYDAGALRRLWQRLAGFSLHADVRRRCAQALMSAPRAEGGQDA